MLERRRPRDEFEIPNMPGGWIDYYTERQFNIEDVIQFQQLAKPSIITCAKQAVGQAKRRCIEFAASALQAPMHLFTMAQNTTGQTVNQIVRRVRQTQAARRRRPALRRRSPRASPRSSPLLMTPVDLDRAATPPFMTSTHLPPTPSPSSHGIVAACMAADIETPPSTPYRVVSSAGQTPENHTPDTFDINKLDPTPSWPEITPAHMPTAAATSMSTPCRVTSRDIASDYISAAVPKPPDTPSPVMYTVALPPKPCKMNLWYAASPSSPDVAQALNSATIATSSSTPAGQPPKAHTTDPDDISWVSPSPSPWLDLSHDVSFVDLNKAPPQTPISPRTAAERQLLRELDEAASVCGEAPSNTEADQGVPVTPQRKPYPSYLEGTDFSSTVPDYTPETSSVQAPTTAVEDADLFFTPHCKKHRTHLEGTDADISSNMAGHNAEPSSIGAPTTTAKPKLLTPQRKPYPSYMEGDASDFSSNVDFSPDIADVTAHLDDIHVDITEFSSYVPFSPEVEDDSGIPNNIESVADATEGADDDSKNVVQTTENVADAIEGANDDSKNVVQTTENVADVTEDIDGFSSYITDFDTPLADYSPDLVIPIWYDQPAQNPFFRNPEVETRRMTRGALRQQAEEERLKEEKTHRNLEKAKISTLTKEWENKVQDAVRTGFAPNFTASDFARVVPPRSSGFTESWLNDESVNGYLKLITNFHNSHHPSTIPKSHAFTSFMFKQIAEKGYRGVERWARRAKIGGADLLETHTIFIPINNGSHWTLMVVYPGARTAHYYDSMGRNRYDNGRRWFDLLKIWLRGELGDQYVERDWSFSDKESPQQNNSSDCGVFAITTAKMLILGAPVLGYGPADIPLQRRRIVAELINGNFL